MTSENPRRKSSTSVMDIEWMKLSSGQREMFGVTMDERTWTCTGIVRICDDQKLHSQRTGLHIPKSRENLIKHNRCNLISKPFRHAPLQRHLLICMLEEKSYGVSPPHSDRTRDNPAGINTQKYVFRSQHPLISFDR